MIETKKRKIEDQRTQHKVKRLSYALIPFCVMFGAYSVYKDESSMRMLSSLYTTYRVISSYKRLLRDENAGTDEWDKLHEENASRLLEMVLHNGGVFVKMGQTIASLNHILPHVYIQTFQKCQDQVKHQSYDEISVVFKNEFGKMPMEIFEEFDPVPVACASLAQVHRAKLKTGEQVAVKIQYNKLETRLSGDLYYLGLIKSFSEWFAKEYYKNDITIGWLLDDFYRNLKIELDFKQEAKNCELFGQMFSHRSDITSPKVYWEYTTKRVITMEYIDGFKLTDTDSIRNKLNTSTEDVSKILTTAYGEQIFLHGFVHVDPHPGNIFVRRNASGQPQLVFLDHGLYRQLDAVFRLQYAKLWKGLVTLDKHTVAQYAIQFYNTKNIVDNPFATDKLYKTNFPEFYRLFGSMVLSRPWNEETDIYGLFVPDNDQSVKTYALTHLNDIVDLLSQFPPDLLLILKTNELLRSTQSILNKGHSSMYASGFLKYAQQALYEHKLQAQESAFNKIPLSDKDEKNNVTRLGKWWKLFDIRLTYFQEYIRTWLMLTYYCWMYSVRSSAVTTNHNNNSNKQ